MKEVISDLFTAVYSTIVFIIGALVATNVVISLLMQKPDDFEAMKVNWQRLKETNKKACIFMSDFFETNSYFRTFSFILCLSFILLNVALGSIESSLLILKGNYNTFQILTPPVLRVASALPLVYSVLPKKIVHRN